MAFFESDQLATLPERESVISMTVYDSIGNSKTKSRRRGRVKSFRAQGQGQGQPGQEGQGHGGPWGVGLVQPATTQTSAKGAGTFNDVVKIPGIDR